jgi:small subunit ribosomal protein S4
MARHTGPVCRLCRREGTKLFLKGDRCVGAKCAIDRRTYPPGQHGQSRRSKPSTYGLQLREKQKAKRTYGVLERQFRRYFQRATRLRGVTGTLLLTLLERRLDTVVHRMGFAASQAAARQLVRHGSVTVNGRKINIPSFQVSVGDIVALKEKARTLPAVVASLEAHQRRQPLHWLETKYDTFEGRLLALPARVDIPVQVNEQMIVELYSK